MLEFDNRSVPLAPDDLVHVTRENGRNVLHYLDILAQNRLAALPALDGASVLELGTGLGNAIPGLLELTGYRGSVTSIDINRSTSEFALAQMNELYSQSASKELCRQVGICAPPSGIVVDLSEGHVPAPSAKRIALVVGNVAEDLVLPEGVFDCAISVWVLYQVADKVRALSNVVKSLKPNASFYATATGSVAVTPDILTSDQQGYLEERVWNTRASKFSWLTGTKELAFWSKAASIRMLITPLPEIARLMFPESQVIRGETDAGRPEGSFVLTRDGNALDQGDLELITVVTTRASSAIPIYRAPHVFDQLNEHYTGVSGLSISGV